MKRLVYFERDGLVWECQNGRTCECEGLDGFKNQPWGEERPLSLSLIDLCKAIKETFMGGGNTTYWKNKVDFH